MNLREQTLASIAASSAKQYTDVRFEFKPSSMAEIRALKAELEPQQYSVEYVPADPGSRWAKLTVRWRSVQL